MMLPRKYASQWKSHWNGNGAAAQFLLTMA